MKEADVLDILAKCFAPPEWAFISHVRNGAGLSATRTADGIAMNLFPSRGMEVWGFEVKTARGDWLSELKNPAKAEEIHKYCDRWFIVGPDDVIKKDEVPKQWGFMRVKNGTVRAVKAAPLNANVVKLDRGFIAMIMRRIFDTYSFENRIIVARMEGRLQGEKDGRHYMKMDYDRLQEEFKRQQKAIEEFEEKSGVHISEWSAGRMGEAVKVVLNGADVFGGLERSISIAQKALDEMKNLKLPPMDWR